MTWNYRIIKHDTEDVPYYAVHEVYYNEKGKAYTWTDNPIDLTGDSKQAIMKDLKLIISDMRLPILSESKLLKMLEDKEN